VDNEKYVFIYFTSPNNKLTINQHKPTLPNICLIHIADRIVKYEVP